MNTCAPTRFHGTRCYTVQFDTNQHDSFFICSRKACVVMFSTCVLEHVCKQCVLFYVTLCGRCNRPWRGRGTRRSRGRYSAACAKMGGSMRRKNALSQRSPPSSSLCPGTQGGRRCACTRCVCAVRVRGACARCVMCDWLLLVNVCVRVCVCV